jgi:hypothetical protein
MFLVVVCVCEINNALKMETLRSGVLLREADIVLKAKEYRIIVTIDKTVINTKPILNVLEEMARSSGVEGAVYLKNRVRIMQHEVQSVERWVRSHARSKRGLVDGVGLITHALFGLATDGEVKEVRQKVEENRRALQRMTTWEGQRMAVINATYQAATANREAINLIGVVMDNFFQLNAKATQIHMEVIHLLRAMDYLKALEDDLNRGVLTPQLLSYEDILSLPKERDEL